jgi:signal peptidase I
VARSRSPRPSESRKSAGDSGSSSDGSRGEPAPPAASAKSTKTADATTKSDAGTKAGADTGKTKDGPSGGQKRSAVLRRVVRLTVLLAIAAIAAFLLRAFVVSPYYIPSGSMEPTLHGCKHCDDDRVLVDKISYHFHSPQRGDIIVFGKPPGVHTPDSVLIKRVIGLPGDRVALRHGQVFINHKRLKESYLDHTFLRRRCGLGPWTAPETSRSRWKIPAGDVFVLGDNRCDSTDSRTFGPIPESSIVGRAFLIVWPLSRITLL